MFRNAWKILFPLLLFSAAGCMLAEPAFGPMTSRVYTVSGNVTGGDGNPVQGITVRTSAGTVKGSTGFSGTYSLQVNTILESITVTASDADGSQNGGSYRSESVTLRFSDTTEYRVDFRLQLSENSVIFPAGDWSY